MTGCDDVLRLNESMRYIPDGEDNEEHEEDSDGEGDHEYDNEGTVNDSEIEDASASMVATGAESFNRSLLEFSQSEPEFESSSYVFGQSHRSRHVSA